MVNNLARPRVGANVRAQKCPKVDSWSVPRTVRSHVRTFVVILSKLWILEFRSAFIGPPKTRRLIPMLGARRAIPRSRAPVVSGPSRSYKVLALVLSARRATFGQRTFGWRRAVFSDLSPNSAPHRDGREASHFGQPFRAPARVRER